MADKEQRERVTQAAEPATRHSLDEVTPEEIEWFRLAGFSRIEWQRLIYARWRYRQGQLTEYPQSA